MNKTKAIVLIIIAALTVAGLAWYFYQRNLSNGLVASGTIEGTEIMVSSRVIGMVTEIKVNEGDQVKEGDVLAQIDISELIEAYKSAQAQYRIAKEDYDRSKKLYADQLISPQQFDALFSNLQVATAALETTKIRLDNATIKAPISGTVLVKAVEKGELAAVGTPIVTLADLSKVKLTVYLPEKDVGKVNLGEAVQVSVDSFPDQKFSGKVVFISEKAEFTPKSIQTRDERVTQVFGIKIEILNPDQKLKPGMPADAEFQWNSQ